MAGVRLENVNKCFAGGVKAVDDLSLEIRDREFTVLVGPSGCGKTTTLRMVAGLEEPTSGDIYIGDRLVNDVPPKDRDIAMVFQNYALYPHMTVYDNMAFGLKLRKVPRPEIDARVKEAAGILNIEELLKRRPRALSGGQRQRVALGRAIVREPQVFLMDEPLSNLDAKLRVQMRAELSRLHKRLEATIIYVTHDQIEAMTMGDRIVVMKGGIIQQVGAPLDIFEHPANLFVATFIGSLPINIMKARIVVDGDNVCADTGSFSVKLPGRHESEMRPLAGHEAYLGIRPERVALAAAAEAGSISVKVDVAEIIGSEANVHTVAGPHMVTIRANAHESLKPGQTLHLRFPEEALHLFDGETEKALF